jgi:hypothetical protein
MRCSGGSQEKYQERIPHRRSRGSFQNHCRADDGREEAANRASTVCLLEGIPSPPGVEVLLGFPNCHRHVVRLPFFILDRSTEAVSAQKLEEAKSFQRLQAGLAIGPAFLKPVGQGLTRSLVRTRWTDANSAAFSLGSFALAGIETIEDNVTLAIHQPVRDGILSCNLGRHTESSSPLAENVGARRAHMIQTLCARDAVQCSTRNRSERLHRGEGGQC